MPNHNSERFCESMDSTVLKTDTNGFYECSQQTSFPNIITREVNSTQGALMTGTEKVICFFLKESCVNHMDTITMLEDISFKLFTETNTEFIEHELESNASDDRELEWDTNDLTDCSINWRTSTTKEDDINSEPEIDEWWIISIEDTMVDHKGNFTSTDHEDNFVIVNPMTDKKYSVRNTKAKTSQISVIGNMIHRATQSVKSTMTETSIIRHSGKRKLFLG